MWISFNKFTDSALNIQVLHWSKTIDYKSYLNGMQEMNLQVKERFDREQIEFAYPTQTIYVKRDALGPNPPDSLSQGRLEDNRIIADSSAS